MNCTERFQQVQDKSFCIYTKEEVEAGLERMAREMEQELKDKNPIFLCVLIGGMIPLGSLIPHLNFQMEVNYIHLASYDLEKNCAGKLVWKAEPTIDLTDRTIVIFDDILDSGITLQAAKEYCEKKGARQVYTAVLLDKKVPRKPGGIAAVDFRALTVDNLFVFGYGLDYSNYLRNLPGIYAIDPKDAI